ncbi:3-oxoacyl-[acyl-carrier protein] reductase [Candidatus Kinetoplastibacterium desouzaii TCC079E]|uniref:3-oxoacyl-[acyl-carrier protein] reductase n=1 Tax=Candidatus Kinetoplastidibacterium desouzai TCC079E TaxID=1208919 RepID=M1LS96_9PROT|nr:3-oxoacyl-ACP reductase FabG [Candidatus Kinetoplastibacterium desouzaii]AGF47011.1 3-oxoacyl-[acyl-carrier protein] reductase [Candidatus Kinetoplastibacterium desouzaii TCC079E]
MGLKGKIVLVTGASRGIGKAIATRFSEEEAVVIGTATTKTGVDILNNELNPLGGRGMILNLMDDNSCSVFIKEIIKEGIYPNILINNAGVTKDSLSIRMKDSDWDNVINTNLTSVFRLSRGLIPYMIKSRWGRIINITSIIGSIGNVGQSNYAASKAGVEAMSRVMAKEFASRGITVNCIAPGFIDTDMTRSINKENIDYLSSQIPMGRLGNVDDIAYSALFLASDKASYINGITLHVNGGMYMQ